MYKAEDYKSGHGQRKKPTTSILPYLKAKTEEKMPYKPQRKPTEATLIEESYDEARRKIIAGDE